jgi:SOS-response transcriptional repressor LexA
VEVFDDDSSAETFAVVATGATATVIGIVSGAIAKVVGAAETVAYGVAVVAITDAGETTI